MTKEKMDHILAQIAKEYNTTPEAVRREMQYALDEAQSNTDPIIQARWKSIPRKGDQVTLEEFLDYTADMINNIC